MNTCIRQLFI